MHCVTINKVDNGYIITRDEFGSPQEVFKEIEELFNELLLIFEGRCDGFQGSRYGRVTIEREEPKHARQS